MTTLGEKLREAIEKRSVIQTTINAWDKHEDQIRKPQQEKAVKEYNFKASNNIMRTTFEHIKNNPNKLPRYHIDELTMQGFKENSVTSVVYQLIKAGQVRKDNNGWLSVAQDEYTPIKQVKKKPRVLVLDKAPEPTPRQIVIVKKPRDKGEGIAALTPDTGLEGAKRPVSSSFYPSAIVDGLTVLHACELYDYLKKIFGGN